MKKVNVIIVYDKSEEKILMCKRRKNPYKGLYNFVGGKVEPGEDDLTAAYRELLEETSIGREEITLTHLMDFTYHLSAVSLAVFYGTLQKETVVSGDENELFWFNTGENFFDIKRYAGEGSIGHMLEQVKLQRLQERQE